MVEAVPNGESGEGQTRLGIEYPTDRITNAKFFENMAGTADI